MTSKLEFQTTGRRTLSIFSAEHILRETVEQAVALIDAAKRDGAPADEWVPVLRRRLRGGLVAADALNGAERHYVAATPNAASHQGTALEAEVPPGNLGLAFP